MLEKIQTYILSRVNLLYTLCYEIPCTRKTEKKNGFTMFRETIKNIWRQESWLTFIGLLLILSVKPVKFLTFDVAFPAVDVYTDSDAAIKHFE